MLSRINKRLAAMSKGARKLANGGLVAVWDEDGVAGVLKGGHRLRRRAPAPHAGYGRR